MDKLLEEVLIAFELDPELCKISPIGEGHIHDTYLVDRAAKKLPPLVLQRMNNYVFKDLDLLMGNMELVSSHIAYKNRAQGKDPAKHGILLLETEDGKSWIGNENDGYWRMFWYIEDQQSYESAYTVEIAYEGGRAIAEFQMMLNDLDPEKIGDTIPEFHNLKMRLNQFDDALVNAAKDRLSKSSSLIEKAQRHAEKMLSVYESSVLWKLPVRLTHNDTKFNNILFHKDGKANCMIDLDTVMSGYSWFDFGDAMRTCASIAPEDEPDVAKIGFRIEVFNGFSEGYLSLAKEFLTEAEISLLPLAPMVFAYMQAVRFLSDYLNGDVYYKTAFAEHNYQRARAQFTLFDHMLDQEKTMHDIVQSIVS